MSRETGMGLIRKYDHVIPKSLTTFIHWLGITEDEFYSYIDPFRDPNIWEKTSNGNWELKDSVIDHSNETGLERVKLSVSDARTYIKTGLLEPHSFDDDFILSGRSFMDKFNFSRKQISKTIS